jgi:hypothetical protein
MRRIHADTKGSVGERHHGTLPEQRLNVSDTQREGDTKDGWGGGRASAGAAIFEVFTCEALMGVGGSVARVRGGGEMEVVTCTAVMTTDAIVRLRHERVCAFVCDTYSGREVADTTSRIGIRDTDNVQQPAQAEQERERAREVERERERETEKERRREQEIEAQLQAAEGLRKGRFLFTRSRSTSPIRLHVAGGEGGGGGGGGGDVREPAKQVSGLQKHEEVPCFSLYSSTTPLLLLILFLTYSP